MEIEPEAEMMASDHLDISTFGVREVNKISILLINVHFP